VQGIRVFLAGLGSTAGPRHDRVHRHAPRWPWIEPIRRVFPVALVIDVFARRIVSWRVSRSAHAAFVLDALEPMPSPIPDLSLNSGIRLKAWQIFLAVDGNLRSLVVH
jgi:hypothetical protein